MVILVQRIREGITSLTPQTEEDSNILTEFSIALHDWSENPTKQKKRRAKQAWLRLEKCIGAIYDRSAGIDRKEVFS